MMDKHRPERPLPPLCEECRSLHKQYKTTLCAARRLAYYKGELLRAVPILGRLVPAWECDLREAES